MNSGCWTGGCRVYYTMRVFVRTDDLHSEPWYTCTKMHSSATMYLYASCRMSVVMTVAHILWPQLLLGFAGNRAPLIIHDHTPTILWSLLFHDPSHAYCQPPTHSNDDTSVAVVQLRETCQVPQSKSVTYRLNILYCSYPCSEPSTDSVTVLLSSFTKAQLTNQNMEAN